MNEYASNGTYYFKTGKILKKYFQELMNKNISTNNEYYCSMVYNLMKEDNLNIRVFKIEKMLQWGTPKDFRRISIVVKLFFKKKKKFSQKI